MTTTPSPDAADPSVNAPSEAQPSPPAVPTANTSGFYRLQGQSLQFAPNEVHAPDYTLSRSNRAGTALPKDGWDWFDTAEAAYAHHNLPLPQPEQTGRPRRPEPRAAGGSGR